MPLTWPVPGLVGTQCSDPSKHSSATGPAEYQEAGGAQEAWPCPPGSLSVAMSTSIKVCDFHSSP